METVATKLVVYGPLGIFCFILIAAVVYLYRAKEKQSSQFQAEIKQINETHKEELNSLMQRHIGKAETWVDKGNELATSLRAVLESIVKRQP